MLTWKLISGLAVAAVTASAWNFPHSNQHHGSSGGGYDGKNHGAINLYVSSYIGTISTLGLRDGNLDLKHTVPCANNASWLTWDAHDRVIYCLDEGLVVPNGTVQSFKASADGVLSPVAQKPSISGPVSGALYGGNNDGHGLALAHYTGSAVSAWLLDDQGVLQNIQDIPFTLAQPGPNPSRQEAPHEHEAILDPTGKYIVVPDLGADLVRVFSIDQDTLLLNPETPLTAAPGSGPRHGAFWVSRGQTYFYLVSELANTLTGYEVSYYSSDSLAFKELFVTGTHGDRPVPAGNAVAEIQISPDQRFIIVSNRNDSSFLLPNFDPANETHIASDSLATWKLRKDGMADFQQLAAAGGSFPRQFSMNADGSLIGVGLQYDSRVVVLERNVGTGLIGPPVANISLPGQITCVVWDEQGTETRHNWYEPADNF